MAKKIIITDNSLIVTDSVTSAVEYEGPAKDLWFDTLALDNGNIIILKNDNHVYEVTLANSHSSADIAYTAATFRTFARAGLGKHNAEVAAGTGVALDLSNSLGTYYNMASANAGTTYTFSGGVVGGWAISLINTSSEPTVTSGTKISGATWVTGTDMYLVVRDNGTTTEYFFIAI